MMMWLWANNEKAKRQAPKDELTSGEHSDPAAV
jgi:hypothetical protein